VLKPEIEYDNMIACELIKNGLGGKYENKREIQSYLEDK
jgi:hypothetical protein